MIRGLIIRAVGRLKAYPAKHVTAVMLAVCALIIHFVFMRANAINPVITVRMKVRKMSELPVTRKET